MVLYGETVTCGVVLLHIEAVVCVEENVAMRVTSIPQS